MDNHLNTEQLMDAMLEMLTPAEQRHFESCLHCQAELATERARFAALKEHAEKLAERPESFWRRQSLVIRERVANEDKSHLWGWAWAAAAATALLIGLWVGELPVKNPSPVVEQAQMQGDQDEALLSSMEDELQRDTPAALEPAELLTSELNGDETSNKRIGSAHPRSVSARKQVQKN